jgi:hypothetical protein
MPPVVSVLLASVLTWFRSRHAMQIELIALRLQVAVYKQTVSRPKLRPTDRVLRSYVDYYHSWRVHRSLDMDAPDPRPIQPPEPGSVKRYRKWVDSIITSGEQGANAVFVTSRTTGVRSQWPVGQSMAQG